MDQIHKNRTGTVKVVLDGEAQDASFISDDPSVFTVGLSSSAQGSVFTGLVSPVANGDSVARFKCKKPDGTTLQQGLPIAIIDGPATVILNFTVMEN